MVERTAVNRDVVGSSPTRGVLSECGSAWSERLVRDQEVAGSNPVTPIL